MTKKNFFLLIASCAVLLPSISQARTSKKAALANQFSTVCALSGQLKKAHAYGHNKLAEAAEYEEAALRLQMQLAVYSAALRGTTDARLAAAVSHALQHKLNELRQKRAELEAAALSFAVSAGIAAGRTDEFFSILSQYTKETPTDGGCLITTDGAGGAAKWAGLATALPGCVHTKPVELTPDTKTDNVPQANFADVKAVTDIADQTSYSETECRFFGDPNTAADAPSKQQIATGSVYYAGGAIVMTSPGPTLKMQGMKDLATSTKQDPFKDASAAKQKLDALATYDATTVENDLYATLMNDEAFLQAAAAILTNSTKKGSEVKQDKALMQTIKDQIVASAEKFKDPYLKGILATTQPKLPQWGVSLTGDKLSGLTYTVTGAKLLQYYTSQPPPDVAQTTCPTEATTPKDDAANQKICEKFHDKPNECPNKTCTYDTKTNKCNLIKPVGGTATPGKEEGAADKKEEKCKGKLEAECTKAPECKWEGKECKDSSILVNKQLVLMVSALVALLF